MKLPLHIFLYSITVWCCIFLLLQAHEFEYVEENFSAAESENFELPEDLETDFIDNDFMDSDFIDPEDQHIADLVDLIGADREDIAPLPKQQQSCSNQLSSSDLLTVITEGLPSCHILRLLQQNAYKHTSPINTRDVLDLISLKPDFFNYCGWQFFAQPFYNQTSKAFFKNSPFIKEHIGCFEDRIIKNELTAILEDLNTLLPTPIIIDIPPTLALFKNIRLQERRTGVMFSFAKRYKYTFFSFRMPFYYLEHNLFLNETEISTIKSAPCFRVNGIDTNSETNPQEELTKILTAALVNDRVGLGDARAKLLFNIADNCYLNAWFGIQATIPIATDFKIGIIGSKFTTNGRIPSFDLKTLVNLGLCNMADKSGEIAFNFGIAALRRLSTILINIPLGHDKHFGIGPYFECKTFINDFWSMRTSARFDVFMPRTQKRFFLITKNHTDFKRDLTDSNASEANLTFINQQIKNTVFPLGICVNVFPGYIVQINHALLYDNASLHWGIGFDFWYKAHEHLGTITGNTIGIFPEGMRKALRVNAYQGKIFTEFGYHGISKIRDIGWEVLFTNDVTFFNKSIGKDFTLGLRLGIHF